MSRDTASNTSAIVAAADQSADVADPASLERSLEQAEANPLRRLKAQRKLRGKGPMAQVHALAMLLGCGPWRRPAGYGRDPYLCTTGPSDQIRSRRRIERRMPWARVPSPGPSPWAA